MRCRAFSLACCVVVGLTVVAAATIKEIKVADGYDDNNRIVAPVYQTAGVSVSVTASGTHNRKMKFVRRAGGNMFTRGPEYDLDAGVNVGALLTDSLRSEAAAMGLAPAGSTVPSWQVAGTIKDMFLESRQVYMGATLFNGYLDVELAVSDPGGRTQTTRMRVHNYSGGYNAGFGRRDEAQSAAAHLFVEGAQEILARLNREYFHAQPNESMTSRLAGLPSSATDQRGELRMIGLSGLQAATPVLLAWLQREQDENLRSAIVDSLALMGSDAAVATLSARYPTEDEDVRWYILKAMDYIGGVDAERLVTTAGLKDVDIATKRLAGRIANRAQ